MGMEHKSFPLLLKQIEDRTVKQLFAVLGVVDDGGDRIWTGAFTKTLAERMDRVKVLWQHDRWEPPVGVPSVLKEIGKADLPAELISRYPEANGALYGEIRYLETPRGDEVLTGIREGAITENSFGYNALKADFEMAEGDAMQIRNLREIRLWDVSPVNWGMNEATTNLKVALPYKDTGTADEGVAWEGPTLDGFTADAWEELTASDKRRIANHFAWAGSMPPETYGDLKLPHHKASKDGIGPAVWRGVAAAMGRLLQAGTDVPDGDRRGVYDHLASHYKQFDKEPPDFKMVQALYFVGKARPLLAELKDGRGFPAANMERAKNTLDSMQGALITLEQLLAAAEPPITGHSALPVETIRRRMRVAEQAIALRTR
jgi:HK97 family phage prohead protease